jgi:hypothetical protein
MGFCVIRIGAELNHAEGGDHISCPPRGWNRFTPKYLSFSSLKNFTKGNYMIQYAYALKKSSSDK